MRTRKQGFTLVELLVVIAIIGVLVALLLPAVQSAREAARRMSCSNNLKQIGLAVHNYHDTFLAMPAGSYHGTMGTWQVVILPYIEQKNLHDIYVDCGAVEKFRTGGKRYGDIVNRQVVNKTIPNYSCPSDVKTNTTSLFSGITSHNYVANYGNTTRGRVSPHGKTSTNQDNVFGGGPFIEVIGENKGGWANYYSWVAHDNTYKASVRMAEITDGTSNTLAMSETIKGHDGDLRGFGWWGGGAHFETFRTPNSSQADSLEAASYCKAATKLNPPCVGRSSGNEESIAARSRHPNGVQAVMCDGSVRFFTNNIALDTWRWLGTAGGGDVVTEP